MREDGARLRQGLMIDLTTVVELLGKEHVAGNDITSAFLDDAVATFSANPAGATSAIRQLQASDPSGFALAAVRLLTTAQQKSPGVQFIAGLMFAGNLLLDPLLDERILHLEAAISLARNLACVEPLLDVRLMQKMIADAGGDVQAIKTPMAVRVFSLVEAISDCSRLSSYLIVMMRHDDAEVRSEAALLLGASTFNLNRVKTFLSSENPLLRATTIESLWENRHPDALAVFREAANDSDRHVQITALIGLTRAGDGEAARRLKELGRVDGPLVEAAAAWAAGEINDSDFAARLEPLRQSEDPFVKTIATRRIRKLRINAMRKPLSSLRR